MNRATPSRLLARLERLRLEYGTGAGERKRTLLRALERAVLPRAAEVARLHEALCFLRAYPDDARLLRQVERMLAAFERRRDLARHRERLADSGIAGTAIRFRFFAPMASWLARRWPERLAVEWDDVDHEELLERLLPLLVHFAETPALDEFAYTPREWVARLKGRRETEAEFLIRRFERLKMDSFAREMLYDEIDLPLVLEPGPGTPSRTRAHHATGPVAFQRAAIARARPSLGPAVREAPLAIRVLSPRAGRRLIDLAREAMVTRQRDLDVFSWASEADVRLVEFGDGLAFACMGAIPERRLLLETVYGYLTLKNGVPIGYVLSAALFESAEIAYNVFDTYRGAEAAGVFARVLAMVRTLFGAGSFMIPPYQLGEGNEEALRSGAWWFYQKLGFRPHHRAAARLMNRELGRMARRPAHRSSVATLGQLASANLHFRLGPRRADVLGRLELARIGLHVSHHLGRRFGADRERGVRACSREAATLLGVRSFAGWTTGERRAWERWAPLVVILPGIRRWRPADRRALAEVVRAKGGRRESDYVRRFDRHAPLRRAIAALAAKEPSLTSGRRG